MLLEALKDRMDLDLARKALKVLAALPGKVQRQIAARIDSLAQEPFPPDAQQIKGQDATWRIRAGSYRIAHTIRRNALRFHAYTLSRGQRPLLTSPSRRTIIDMVFPVAKPMGETILD